MFLEGACRLTRSVRAGHLKVANKVHAPSHPILASRARSRQGSPTFFLSFREQLVLYLWRRSTSIHTHLSSSDGDSLFWRSRNASIWYPKKSSTRKSAPSNETLIIYIKFRLLTRSTDRALCHYTPRRSILNSKLMPNAIK